MPGLDIAITWITEIVADEIIIPIVGAGAINMGRSVYKRLRRKSGDPQDSLEAAEVQVHDQLQDRPMEQQLSQPTTTSGTAGATSTTESRSSGARTPDARTPAARTPDARDASRSPAAEQPYSAIVPLDSDLAARLPQDQMQPIEESALTVARPQGRGSLQMMSAPDGGNGVDRALSLSFKQLEYRRIRGELLLKRVQIARLQQDRVTWLIWSVGFGWSVYAALTPLELTNFTNPKLGLLLFLGANFVMGLVRIAVDASLLKSLQVELEASQHQLDHLDPFGAE
ncbi:MAG: hypothetical protein ACO4AI_03815 [Prochlorothrix sp.]